MSEPVNLLSRRSIPHHGYDVHVYDIEDGGRGLVVLYLDGRLVWQDNEASFALARARARQMADHHKCAMIEHHPYANRKANG